MQNKTNHMLQYILFNLDSNLSKTALPYTAIDSFSSAFLKLFISCGRIAVNIL